VCREFLVGEHRTGNICDAPNNNTKLGSLSYLDKSQMQAILTKTWQRELNTDQDPANHKWYENGANGDQVGLYGGLTDSIDPNVYVDDSRKVFSRDVVAVFTQDADNRNGLNPSPVVTLSFQHSFTQSQSHTVSNTFKQGVAVDVKVSATVFGIGADVTTKFSFDYTYSTSTTKSTSETDTATFTTQVPLKIPTGQVFRVVLQATKQHLSVPTMSYCNVAGETETWFESRVNGHYDWMTDAGNMFGWIRQFSTAGTDSPNFTTGNGIGRYVTVGTLEGQNYVDMCSKVYNITSMRPGQQEISLSDANMLYTDC